MPRNVEPFSQGRQATNQVTLMKLSAEVNFVLDLNSSALILDGFTIQLSSFLSTLAHRFSVKLVVFWLISLPLLTMNFEAKMPEKVSQKIKT